MQRWGVLVDWEAERVEEGSGAAGAKLLGVLNGQVIRGSKQQDGAKMQGQGIQADLEADWVAEG